MKNPAKTIAKARKDAKLSVEALATLAGLSRQAVHAIEQGTRKPSLETARAICKALGKSLSIFD